MSFNWGEFCGLMDKLERTQAGNKYTQINHDKGHPGKAVYIWGFGGDGSYPVSLILPYDDGPAMGVVIDFSGDLGMQTDYSEGK